MKKTKHIALATVSALIITSANGAILISNAGPGSNYAETNMQGFRSTNVTKSYDGDNDNVYGTAGLYFIGNTSFATHAFDNTFTNFTQVGASFASFSAGTDATHYNNPSPAWNYSDIDDPTATPGVDVADWSIQSGWVRDNSNSSSAGDWQELLTFTIDSTTPSAIRVGIMASTMDNANFSPSGIRLTEAGGAETTITGLSRVARLTGMVFFDIDLNGETSGTFSISAQTGVTAPGIAGVTFDEIIATPIPEPSTAAIMGLGIGALLMRRKR